MAHREVTRALACALFWFLLAPVLAYEDTAVQVEPLAKSVASWNGSVLPAYPTGQPEVTVLRYRIAPGARLPLHKHPFINAAVVLTGELTVVSQNGETLQLKAGDAAIELVDQWHYGHNRGAGPVELVVFYAGIEGQPLTQHEALTSGTR
jgi:quercetin dioxygenase-like cupin family protein